jgi:hypothetical protein
MAVAAVTLVNTTQVFGSKLGAGPTLQTFNLAIAPAADTYATGGLTVPWRSAVKGTTKPPLPGSVKIQGKAGYVFEYDDANQKVIVRTGAAAQAVLTELTAAAVPAPLSGDTIKVIAMFPFGG